MGKSNEVDKKRENTIFFVLLFWVFLGAKAIPLFYFVFGLSIFYWAVKRAYVDLLIGFVLVLVLADSFQAELNVFYNIRYIYILFLFVVVILNKKVFLPFITVHYAFVPFLFLVVICSFFNENVFLSLQKGLSYTLLFFTIPQYVQYFLRTKLQDKFYKKLIFLYTLILLSGLFCIILYRPFVFSRIDFRYNGLFSNPNGLGLFCTIALMTFILIKEYNHEVFTPIVNYLFIFGISASLLLSGARISIIGSLFFITIYIVQKKRFFFLVMPIYLIGSFIFVFNIQFQDIAVLLGMQKYFRIESIAKGSGRYVAWNYGYSKINMETILGKGFGYTEQLFFNARNELSKFGHQGNAHNSFLTIWLDTGLLGLFYFIIGFFSIFLKTFKRSFIVLPIFIIIGFTGFLESWLCGSLNAFTFQLLIIFTLLYSNTFFLVGFNENS